MKANEKQKETAKRKETKRNKQCINMKKRNMVAFELQ